MNAPAAQTVAKRKKDDIRAIEHDLTLLRSRLVSALPAHVPVKLFIATVLTACAVEPKLLQCDRHSLFLSALKAARDGLLPDGREAALVPFKDNKLRIQVVVYIPMFAGLLKKVRNSGELASLSANAVYEKDVFEYELGDNERILHKPVMSGARGKLFAAYAIARTKDGGVYRRVLSAEDVLAIKAFSKAAATGPWSGPFESEMWIKTAIRRLSKILPQSTDINNYLNAGPPLPGEDVDSVLPDSTGAEGMHALEFDLRTRAMLTLREESDSLDLLNTNWAGIKTEYHKISAEIPLELEDVFNMAQERLKEAAAAPK